MRNLKLALVALSILALAGCEGTPGIWTPTPGGPSPLPLTTQTPPPPPSPAAPGAATPTPSPEPPSGVVGPLEAGGYPIEALVMPPGSSVRYVQLPGRLARSDDGGLNWLQVSEIALPFVVSPHDPRTLYAGDMAPCYAEGATPTLRRSRDGGETWQELPGGLGIRPLAEHPDRAGTLYGVSCAGLHLSADAGETWETTGATDGLDITSILPLAGEPLRFLAVLTSEGGSSRLAWFDEAGRLVAGAGEGLSFWGRGALAQAGEALYVASSTGVWQSGDGGEQWVLHNDGLADVALAADPLVAGISEEDMERGFGLYALAADPASPERLALGSVRGVYLSEDHGEHWRPAPAEALAALETSAVQWDPAIPNVLYATTSQGLYAVHLPAD